MKKTIIDLFEDSVVKYGAKTFLLEKKHRAFEPTTYAETKEQALEIGAGLAAAGIRPGDKVAILSEGCNAWITSELGVFYAGAVSVPLSVKLEESNDLLFRMRHAEVRALFVSKYQLSKIRRIRAELPQVEHIIVIGHIPLEAGETALGTLRRMGRDYLAANSGGVPRNRPFDPQRRLRDDHLHVGHHGRPERRRADAPQLYGQRRTVALAHRHPAILPDAHHPAAGPTASRMSWGFIS